MKRKTLHKTFSRIEESQKEKYNKKLIVTYR
jgi:hypothetical protein